MFERFTAGARATVVVAQDSARFLGHRGIGTEHVLLGLIAGGEVEVAGRVLAGAGVWRERVIAGIERIEQARQEPERDLAEKDAAALRTIGIDLDAVRAAVEESFGPGALDGGNAQRHQGPWWRRPRQEQRTGGAPRGHIPFTPRAKKVLELSLREAQALNHDYIGTEHVLLGLIREGQGRAAQILHDEHVPLEQLRDQVLAELQRAG
ncbi:ATP-dependent Clp protease ATP-binding subunit ClpA [Catenulispora sp. GP43]|uniref:Clp protease N-terminal domain-containing protein n=1 Tax=Catenulispora sp. GP43 TaxID=3156263 RepID=UPI0035144393